MGLKKSIYSGGGIAKHCSICGVNIIARTPIAKCTECAKKIAADVEKDFKDNRGHYMTEAILIEGTSELMKAIDEAVVIRNEIRRRITTKEDAE